MSRDVGVRIQRQESFHGLHPASGRSVLLQFDHRVSLRCPYVAAATRGNHISGKDDLLLREVHLQITTRVPRSEVEHIDSYAVDRERLALRQGFVWQAILRRRITGICRRFYVLLTVIVGDYGQARRVNGSGERCAC